MMQSGTSDNRVAQLMHALDPEYIKVDGRDSRDRLAFAARFAELIMFYNKNNQLAGNWKPFFVKDPLILLAVISKTDYTGYHRKFTQLHQQINKLSAGANNDQKVGQNSNAQTTASLVQPATATSVADYALPINQLFLLLQQMFCTINEWVHFMQMDARQYYLREFVYKKICENIAPQLWQMVALQQGFTIATKGAIEPPDTNTYNQFNAVWRDQKISQTNYSVQIDPRAQTASNAATESAQVSIESAIEQIQAIYHLVFSFFLQVIDNAKQSFYQMENQQCDYPDTALLITFSRLMENQQQLLNQFSGKHLDFYYKDILQQSPRSAQPDQVNICVQLADTIDSLSLPAGTEFIAGKYPDKSNIIFVSLADAEINRAAISSAYTLYYSAPLTASTSVTSNLPTENLSLANPSLYLETIVNANQVIRNQQQEIVSWDGFGNSQSVPIQQGFALASPMLYLQGGERTITLVFEFNNELPANFFDDSQVYLSTEKSWLLVAAHTVPTLTGTAVKANTSTGTSIISCQLKVMAAGPAIVPFVVNPDDPDNPASPWPLLKVILGKSVNLRAPPILLSVSIQVDVKKFNKLNLANDISALPATGPALIFGPIPSVGSCFYIGSNEIFAKPLTELTLTFAWDGLPLDFESYYASYNEFLDPKTTQFSNSAFQGQWTLLTHTTWQNLSSLAPEKKSTTPDVSTGSSVALTTNSNTSVADNSDATLVKNPEENPTTVNVSLFQPQAEKATQNSSTSIFIFVFDQAAPYIPSPELMLVPLPLPSKAENGYVCVELTTPSYAFGHSLYPKVVANVSLVNAQLLIKQAKVNDPGIVVIIIKKIVAKVTELITRIKTGMKKMISGLLDTIKKLLKPGSKKITEDVSKDETKKPAAPTENDDSVIQPMPDLPYSPKQSGLLVNYSAIAKTVISSAATPTNDASTQINYPFQLYHYGSFKSYLVFDALKPDEKLGLANLTPNQSNFVGQVKLFSGVSGQGCLYLAIKNLLAPCTLRLWVELSQDDNANELSADSVGYYFWTVGGWQELTVLQNETNNFNCSGIIVFAIPPLSAVEARDENLTYLPSPIMPGSDFWLAIVGKKTNLNIKFSYINTQAITLTRASLTSLPLGESPVISATSISTTKEKMIKIASVTQPFASMGGAPAEDQNSYYWRVSNRLNHKDRVSTCTNYDSMAKAAYANLFYVKTLTSGSISTSSVNKTNAGIIRLGLVNAYANAQLPNAFRPVVNACDKAAIIKYIAARVSAMAQISVFNLNHQIVTIKATLIVKSLANSNALNQQINQELKIYLSPWIVSDFPQMNFQQGLSRAALTNFLIRYQGVVELAELSICLSPVNATVENALDTTDNDDTIFPAVDTIFVSAIQHKIQIQLSSAHEKLVTPQSLHKVLEVTNES